MQCGLPPKHSIQYKAIILIFVLIGSALSLFAAYQRTLPDTDNESAEIAALIQPGELPVMLELGSETCLPCQKMKIVVKDLQENYNEYFDTRYIDVVKHKEIPEKFKINTIPTQIFLTTSGNELFRHEGYFPASDILAKWSELGYGPDLNKSALAEVKKDEGYFASVYHAIQGGFWLALGGAFIWGIFSVILSPCHLSSIPLVISFISGQGKMSNRRAFSMAFVFAIGILITIAIIGLITILIGAQVGDLGKWGDYFVALLFFVVGLYLLEVVKNPIPTAQLNFKRKGMLSAFLLGLIFGIAMGPCTFAYLTPILGVVAEAAGNKEYIYASAIILVYALGHCLVIGMAGTFTEAVEKYLNWNESSSGATKLKKFCGLIIILGGFYLLYK